VKFDDNEDESTDDQNRVTKQTTDGRTAHDTAPQNYINLCAIITSTILFNSAHTHKPFTNGNHRPPIRLRIRDDARLWKRAGRLVDVVPNMRHSINFGGAWGIIQGQCPNNCSHLLAGQILSNSETVRRREPTWNWFFLSVNYQQLVTNP